MDMGIGKGVPFHKFDHFLMKASYGGPMAIFIMISSTHFFYLFKLPFNIQKVSY